MSAAYHLATFIHNFISDVGATDEFDLVVQADDCNLCYIIIFDQLGTSWPYRGGG